MEQSVLRARPMPGRGRSESGRTGPVEQAPAGHPHGARSRGRRIRSVVFSLSVGSVLVLSGVGLGAVGASALGLGIPGARPHHAAPPAAPAAAPASAPAAAGAAETRSGATLGLEAVDDGQRAGALITAVHVPGPGYTAGLVRGDALVRFGATPIATAADLARAVAGARPGAEVIVTVRHQNGVEQSLTAVPGVVT
ncbi:PDZ domain-containing protein [Streptomyces sp. LaPpAH-108]|uniref:PDZ domain-containing protein n=1 Tax=Streptomyces sp. LaPpAH-108 TaxID=1155714 RepID=UPI000477EE56|nr:PDZ domain-containing protein [Streptomyces sp. LaPpAH-108]